MNLAVSDLVLHFSGTGDVPDLAVNDLACRAGALSVISGPSGSGKTTLLQLLSGLRRASSGSILWDDEDIAMLSERRRDLWRRQHAGLVFQNFHLMNEMNARQNVVLPAYFAGWSAKSFHQRADQLLGAFGVETGLRHVDSYSRGEQQRIAIARALIFDPQVIFADEPTASLDGASAQMIAELLQGLAREENRTVIAVSHDPALISRADISLVMAHGRAVNKHPEALA